MLRHHFLQFMIFGFGEERRNNVWGLKKLKSVTFWGEWLGLQHMNSEGLSIHT